MTPNFSGRITEIYVEPNKLVTKGQPLFQIDPRPYNYEVASPGLAPAFGHGFHRCRQHTDLRYFTKNIIEQQGGRIWAESILGEGTQFHVRLSSGTAR